MLLRGLRLAPLLLILPGCTSAVYLRHPGTGQVAKCGPYYNYGLGAVTVPQHERNRVGDYQRQGFERIPEPTAAGTAPAPAAARDTGLSGTYAGAISGTANGQTFTVQITFSLVQSGAELAGVWNTSAGASGTLATAVTEGRLTDFRARQLDPCPGQFQGAAVPEGGGVSFTGSYAGSDCASNLTASFRANRQ